MKGMKVNTEVLLKLIQGSPMKDEDVAAAAGISIQMFSYIKNGKKGSTYPTIERIASVFNVPVDVLIDPKNNLNKKELQWLQLLHEANSLGLTNYVDGQMDSLRTRMQEIKSGDTPAIQAGFPPGKRRGSSPA